ncbi:MULTISPECIES: nuclear transport factor 2 family protein [Streptomyces]|uniref:Nuclear transport factor 2 family protein n=1 Tax=Streptomyces fuscus TaxID=3048495 RepID=A0ABT7J1S9_9ACTN|nr:MULTISPECIES: nuclear transport factor 2 family protein [Streptomyces]MCM1972453.1 nuclear transport factor 2 family protein [Streptomyces sp. G1]MDL2078269.1 nuclear transport factor 2 family protein [Streptomyces fuscus]SBT90018.1 bifunctional aromatase (cyclase/dehydratase) [Streptomyces sp. DI166]
MFADPALYTEIAQFYAWHMALMDNGEPDAWADAYTEDAVFEEPGRSSVLRGREAIRAAITKRVAELAAAGTVMRHWTGNLSVTPQPDGSLRAQYYSLVMRAPRGERPDMFAHVVCRDVLVRRGDRWLIRHRHIGVDALEK